MLGSIINSCHDFRRVGSAALDISYLACGRNEAFFESLSPWDIAAACLIADEAGAKRFHFRPPPPNFSLPEEIYALDLLVAAPGVAQQIYNELSKFIK